MPDWPAEIVERLTKSMCPEKVCRVCGEPSRRVISQLNEARGRLSAEVRRGRLALGLSQKAVAEWFPSVSGGLTGCVWNWENAKNVPTVEQWPILKEGLGLSDEFDELIAAESRWNDAEYVRGGSLVGRSVWTSGILEGKGAHSNKSSASTRVPPALGWSDCGHDDWRPGVVLDPFASDHSVTDSG